MSLEDASSLLYLFGYDEGDDGWFRLSADTERVLLRREIEHRFLQIAPELADPSQFVDLQRRLREERER